MNELTFDLNLTFSDKIYSDDDMKEIQQRVLNAISLGNDLQDIAPDDSDIYVTAIKVFNPLTQQLIGKLY